MFPFHSPNMFKPLHCLSLFLVPIFFWPCFGFSHELSVVTKKNWLFGKSCKSPKGWVLMEEGYLHA
jgi:hypothetical protein